MRNTRWIAVVAALVLAAAVGAVAYNIGVAQGTGDTGTWHRAWHPGFFFAPFFFILFWVVVARGLFWRGGCGRGRYGQNGLDEWHRQAHERMWNDPTGGGTASR